MYYPYFRGKQYELITIREKAELLKESGFVPIIEPVKQSFVGLERSLEAISEVGGSCILVVNPQKGDHQDESSTLEEVIQADLFQRAGFHVGILLPSGTNLASVQNLCRKFDSLQVTLIHCGYAEGRRLAVEMNHCKNVSRHVFFEADCGKLYRRHFETTTRVLLRDGFQNRVNREHPDIEPFSDLHVTYKEEGMQGFGDFLMIGDVFSETGGPAYAVAIHLTFIDSTKDDEMYIRHFVSDRTDTPADPAGKFSEALTKLVDAVEEKDSQIKKTSAVEEFLELHHREHYPGLGYVKKLSMIHHIETLSEFLNRSSE